HFKQRDGYDVRSASMYGFATTDDVIDVLRHLDGEKVFPYAEPGSTGIGCMNMDITTWGTGSYKGFFDVWVDREDPTQMAASFISADGETQPSDGDLERIESRLESELDNYPVALERVR
ncbi:MAG: hypothetical protein SVY41_02555, partial [Candidatus Nanohaloarchaea archaeon]|nr:hypothetical protein [Candidatus Nanohaloarchaea archaeon]